jgi:hypothetical protein
VTETEPSGTPNTSDTLRQIIDAIESNPTKPGEGFTVTLYLPWGVAVGEIVPAWYFESDVAGELRTVGVGNARDDLAELGDKLAPKQGETAAHASDEYVHLFRQTLCYVNGEVYGHGQLRVRLADVTAWTFGRGTLEFRHDP